MYSLQKLSNGLPLLTAPIEGTESITVHVFAGAGSRYETRAERGVSHFLEHMFFKGGKKYKNAAEVSMAIDAYGGSFNAFTGKEYAGYYVKIAASHIDIACEVLSDMLLHATLPEEEAKKERGVIIEELRMYQDTPMYQAGWDFEELLFGDEPLGWDTIGVEETINATGHKELKAHKDLLYTPDNMVLVFSGKITEKEAMKLGEQFFSGLKGKKGREFAPLNGRGKEQIMLTTKKTEQSHLVLGVEGANAVEDDHFPQSILSVILGGNMSSRMFLKIREARGLCYYISASTDDYMDTGSLSIRAGVDQSRLDEAITAIKNELLLAADKGVTEEEMKRAKEFLKGKITLGLEDSEERAHFYGRQQLLYANTKHGVLDVPALFAEIDGVTKAQVDAFAKKTLSPAKFRLVVIGNRSDKKALEKLLEA
ncbi:MAG TPA: pitrilysin family protein [Candidatus Peribacterales bacterium]|nr:pitrilysin family protein [Candidatus Peribacterales bacterium]